MQILTLKSRHIKTWPFVHLRYAVCTQSPRKWLNNARRSKSLTPGPAASPANNIYFKSFIFSPSVPIRIDYVGKYVDMSQVRMTFYMLFFDMIIWRFFSFDHLWSTIYVLLTLFSSVTDHHLKYAFPTYWKMWIQIRITTYQVRRNRIVIDNLLRKYQIKLHKECLTETLFWVQIWLKTKK